MQLGIRTKLIGTLILAGLFPLLLTLVVVIAGVIQHRTNSIGRSFSRVAQQQAVNLSVLLSSQIDHIRTISRLPGTAEFLRAANAIPPSDAGEIAAIEAAWPDLSDEEPPLRDILENALAANWQAVQRQQPRFAEIMITDITGRLIAASNKTSDYWQANEQWWQDCFADGEGHAFLHDVRWDASALRADGGAGVLVADLCLPLYGEPPADVRQVIGIMKVSIDAGWLLDQIDRSLGPEDSHSWLVNASGQAIAPSLQPAPVEHLSDRVVQAMDHLRSGWIVEDEMVGNELVGFAAVDLPMYRIDDTNADWYVVVATSRGVALRPLYEMVLWIVFAGIGVILMCFFAGLIIARREILRPLLALSRGVSELRRGNIGYRLPIAQSDDGNGVFRQDEIGRLASDFNQMADQLRHHVRQLQEANRTKQQFIDVASHELRTPVTYILGMSQLALQRAGASDAPLLAKISHKARRLAHIVENMFKLLQQETYVQTLQLQPVDVRQVIQEACQELEPFLIERRQKWNLHLDDDLKIIQADPEKLRDILANLLSNAIRFSPDDEVIDIAAESRDGGVRITIVDHGPGIPSKDMPRVFQPFFTVTEELPRHSSGEYEHMTRGIGLGLSVVKRFVDMHGGNVRIETSPQGTQITIDLPASPPNASSSTEVANGRSEITHPKPLHQAASSSPRSPAEA
jgi:signal transduction histidine kinase